MNTKLIIQRRPAASEYVSIWVLSNRAAGSGADQSYFLA
jgi:hypothetical protein